MTEEINISSHPETIVILGAPGSGKDTQSEFLADALGYKIISTGDLCRILAGHNEEVKKLMEKGDLIPDSIVEDELISTFALLPDEQPVILDGYPRNIEQAKKLNTILEQNARKLDRVIYISVTEEEAIKRIGRRRICERCGAFSVYTGKEICGECGGALAVREDDKEAAVKERFKVFHERTEPMINFYKEEGKLAEVDGNLKPEEVREEIKKAL